MSSGVHDGLRKNTVVLIRNKVEEGLVRVRDAGLTIVLDSRRTLLIDVNDKHHRGRSIFDST